jgi:TetR/AcrR family transcriptional regulator
MSRARKHENGHGTASRILAAAENHFAAEGFKGARTDEIASTARANKAMLYYYFGDKRKLHRAVLENLLGRLNQVIEDVAKSTVPAPERLAKFLDGYFEFIASHPNWPRLVQREAMASTAEFEWMLREFLRPYMETLGKILESGIQAGKFRRVDTRHAVFSMIGMINFYFIAAKRHPGLIGGDLLSPKAMEQRKKALQDLLMHGLLKSHASEISHKVSYPGKNRSRQR